MSQESTITGTLKIIGETQIFPSGFTKRAFVVTTADEKYPQDIAIDAVKDGCDRLDSYEVGDEITVSFNIRGSEWKGKHYVQLQAWKFDRTAGRRPAEGARSPEYGQRETSQNGAPPPSRTATADALDEEIDDIPF